MGDHGYDTSQLGLGGTSSIAGVPAALELQSRANNGGTATYPLTHKDQLAVTPAAIALIPYNDTGVEQIVEGNVGIVTSWNGYGDTSGTAPTALKRRQYEEAHRFMGVTRAGSSFDPMQPDEVTGVGLTISGPTSLPYVGTRPLFAGDTVCWKAPDPTKIDDVPLPEGVAPGTFLTWLDRYVPAEQGALTAEVIRDQVDQNVGQNNDSAELMRLLRLAAAAGAYFAYGHGGDGAARFDVNTPFDTFAQLFGVQDDDIGAAASVKRNVTRLLAGLDAGVERLDNAGAAVAAAALAPADTAQFSAFLGDLVGVLEANAERQRSKIVGRVLRDAVPGEMLDIEIVKS